jgi:SPP1 gp7 family putative phage head morphogenesis protein
VALALSHEDLQRASLAKNRAVLDPLTRSFKGTSLEERAVLHYGGEEGEKLARLLTKTDLKAVLTTVPKAEGAEDFEAVLDRNLSAPWRARKILETEHHGAFQAVGVEKAAAIGRQSKTWNTRGDSKVRPSHRSLNGVTISINALFWNGLSHPCDPFCRCYLTFSGDGPGRDLVMW